MPTETMTRDERATCSECRETFLRCLKMLRDDVCAAAVTCFCETCCGRHHVKRSDLVGIPLETQERPGAAGIREICERHVASVRAGRKDET